MKSHYQDEFILGAHQQVADTLTVGARAIWRELKRRSTIRLPRPVCRYMAANYSDFSYQDCLNNFSYQGIIFNLNKDAKFDVNVAAPNAPVKLRHVDLTKQDLGMPDPKRKYASLNIYAEHPFTNN